MFRAWILRLGAVLVALQSASCSKTEAPSAPQAAPPEVTVQPVNAQDVPIVPEFVGQTESSRQVEIRARVSGYLDRRLYREGALVKAGDELFLLDRKPLQAQLQAAKAELAQRVAAHETALANLKRIEPLAAKNAVSLKDRDDAIGQERTTAASVEGARASVIQAELNLSYTRISSPVTGISSFAKVAEGTYVDASNNLLTYVAALSPMRVNFSVSENQVLGLDRDVKQGQLRLPPQEKMEVEVVMGDGSVFAERGHLTFADASFSQDTGTFLARAELPNKGGQLRPGQFVRLRIMGAVRPGGVLVPQRAVLQTAKGNMVFVVGPGNKAQVRMVNLDGMSGDYWLVGKGLKAGDLLVVEGGMRLQPDTPVKIVKRLEPPKIDVDKPIPVTQDAGKTEQDPARGLTAQSTPAK
ncbi:efflux RND transporter periplasmic adaptor subunit [Niveibacterium sp. SC-1]|uniref:efflux RND transporter periplasmic adaptor subunit n=1 Tax=Niveibacterium sp. SC-1 TaxID=3135646 RepID=UPI00311D9C06